MVKRSKKCINCNHATYKAAKDIRGVDAKRGELCLYCTRHCKKIDERHKCDDWTPVKGDIW